MTSDTDEATCEAECLADTTCEMYLMSDETTCRLYKDVSGVTKFGEAGSGHDFWGKLREDLEWNDPG